MNLGLGNLAELKRNVLPEALLASDQFDALLIDLGKGVATEMETFCNRCFGRVAGEVDQFYGNRSYWILRRFPFETIASVEVQNGYAEAGVVQTSAIRSADEKTGVVDFGAVLGVKYDRIKITYTGGFWFDTSENGSGTLPGGATALPADLSHAWHMQCQRVFEQRDSLGVGSIKEKRTDVGNADWLPAVSKILTSYVRFVS